MFKKNIITSSIVQVYATVIGLLVIPIYLRNLGPSAYGLIGFFAVLKGWLRLLDMGMMPALGREIASARGAGKISTQVNTLIRSYELIFFIISALLIVAFFLMSKLIATKWLSADGLNSLVVTHCIVLMGIIFAFNWARDLYGAGLSGMEKFGTYNSIKFFDFSLQYLGGLFLLMFISHDVVIFFIYQLLVAIIIMLFMLSSFYYLNPGIIQQSYKISAAAITKVLPFSMSIAFSSLVWVIATQSDKLVFSNILSLKNFGYFSLVITVCNGIPLLIAPISQVITPRLAYLHSNSYENMKKTYLKASVISAAILCVLGGLIALYSYPILLLWTGSTEAATFAHSVLTWYVLAACITSLLSFQYNLQCAHGNLTLHNKYNLFLLLVKTPIVIAAAYAYGPLITAKIWFLFNVIFLVTWVPYINSIYAKGINIYWARSLLCIIIFSAVIFYLLGLFMPDFDYLNRMQLLLDVASRALIISTFSIVLFFSFRGFLCQASPK